MNNISKTLKQLCVDHGYSQRDIASKLGVSYQTYNAWENNPDSLTMKKIDAIASVFGVDANSILLGYELKK